MSLERHPSVSPAHLKLRVFTVPLLLFCICDVRPLVNGLWVQSGDGAPDGDVKCPLLGRLEPGASSPPPKLFLRLPRHRCGRTKWARVGRTPDTNPVAFDGTFVTCQIISTRWPDLIGSLSAGGHQSEHRMFTQSSVRHEQNRSGRTLRISTVAGTPPYATTVAAVCFVRHSRCPVPCVCSCTFGTLFRYLWQYTASKS